METEITIENLINDGFEVEVYNGKQFFRRGNSMVTYIDCFGKWVPCNPETHCFNGYLESMEQLHRLMEEGGM